MKNIYIQLLEFHSDINSMVLATVTGSHGSTPQKSGSSALFSDYGLITGTVGGGITEAKIQRIAVGAVHSKESGLFHFDLSNKISDDAGPICGGMLNVLVDANLLQSLPVFEMVRQSLVGGIPGVLITIVKRIGEQEVNVNRFWVNNADEVSWPAGLNKLLRPSVLNLLSGNNPSFLEVELQSGEASSDLFFLEPVFPPAHLVIAGAGHIGKALAHLGSMIGFEVTVIDDRTEYANFENIKEADHIIVEEIGHALNALKKSKDTYVVIVTRGHKDDAAALKPCIGSDLAYTGMIGSKSKIAEMRKHFIDNEWANAGDWDKIYAPIGLDISSNTVEEIAVSIAAQLIMIRNRRNN